MVAERIAPTTCPPRDDPDTLYFGIYNTAARRIAAREGWVTRRCGPTPWQRFLALCPRVADGPARLLCCDLAERIALPVYQEAYPGDPRPQLILWVARRYARGEATERERLGLRQVTLAMIDALDPATLFPRTEAGIALQAMGWCLGKPTSEVLWACRNWLERLIDEPAQDALLREIVAALEAMPMKARKEAPAQQQVD